MMPTALSAITSSVSRSPATHLLPRCHHLLTTPESKSHLAAKRKNSMTALMISTELRRNRNKDLKKTQLKRTTAQPKDARELPLTTSLLLSVNRNVIRRSVQPNNREKRSTSRLRLRSKESLKRRNLLNRRFVRSKSRLNKQRKSVSSRTSCS